MPAPLPASVAASVIAGLCLAAPACQAGPLLAQRIEATALAHAAGLPGEVRVRLGQPALPLPPCEDPQTFMPAGSRPFGELQVAVRCQGGAGWTRFVPVQVQVWVRHAVAARALPPGQRLTPEDVSWLQADLARLPRQVVLDEAHLAGARTVQALPAGTPLRRDWLQPMPVILQGQVVRVVTEGPGYRLSTEGKAQASAAPGQALRLRLANGQAVTAVARPDGSAEAPP